MKSVVIKLRNDGKLAAINANTWGWDDNSGMLNVYDINNEIVFSTRQDEVLHVIRVDDDNELESVNRFLDNLYKK